MPRWKVPVYDLHLDIESILKMGVEAHLNALEKEQNELQLKRDRYISDYDEFRNPFLVNSFESEQIRLIEKYLKYYRDAHKMVKEMRDEIINLPEALSYRTREDSNSDFIAEIILQFLGAEVNTQRIVRIISYMAVHNDYLELYANLYCEIKRVSDWYIYDTSIHNIKVENVTLQVPLRKKTHIPEKTLRRSAAILVEILFDKKPDIKNKIKCPEFQALL